jgi:hypothetical protein
MEQAAQDVLEIPQTPSQPEPAKRQEAKRDFARLTRCVRETFALETRIAAGKLPAAPPEAASTANDPRRPMIRNFILDLIDTAPQPKSIKAGFRNQLDPLITEFLEADPEQDHPAGAIVLDICQELGIPCSTAQMPDELLVHPHRDYTEAEKAGVADIVYRRIHGHDPPT